MFETKPVSSLILNTGLCSLNENAKSSLLVFDVKHSTEINYMQNQNNNIVGI